jgi:hypothetical protein
MCITQKWSRHFSKSWDIFHNGFNRFCKYPSQTQLNPQAPIFFPILSKNTKTNLFMFLCFILLIYFLQIHAFTFLLTLCFFTEKLEQKLHADIVLCMFVNIFLVLIFYFCFNFSFRGNINSFKH